MSPRIITYTTDEPDVPNDMRAAASMMQDAPGHHWMATGPTPQIARDKLIAHWEKHLKPGRTAKPKAPAEDIGDII